MEDVAPAVALGAPAVGEAREQPAVRVELREPVVQERHHFARRDIGRQGGIERPRIVAFVIREAGRSARTRFSAREAEADEERQRATEQTHAAGVEKVDSGVEVTQHTAVAKPRQLRSTAVVLLVAVHAAASSPVTAQQEQPRVVRGLAFDGNRAIDDYTLSTAIATSASSWAARYWWVRWTGLGEKRYLDELELRRDVVRLVLLYRQSGYMNAVVDTVVRRTGRDAFVRFRIHEGEPVRVTRFDLLGLDSLLDTAALRRELPLRIGAAFNRFLYQASSDTVLAQLRNLGYPYADVYRSFQADGENRQAEVALDAVPGPRMRIGSVILEGLRDIDSATVRRILPIHPGGVYRQSQLFRSQRELYGLGVFRFANVVLLDSVPGSTPSGDSTVRVLVQVEEGARHRVR